MVTSRPLSAPVHMPISGIIRIGEATGAKTIDLEWVEVHPTGSVKPDAPDAEIKFLAAEALCGVGGCTRRDRRALQELDGTMSHEVLRVWQQVLLGTRECISR